MAQWYHFYEHDRFEPEIQIGLYDRWLSQLGCGPTQAERVFVHTPMMEVAHERRFVVSETKQQMSHFEIEHSQRVELTISHLVAYFANNPSNELEDSSLHEHKALIGLAPMPLESRFIEIFPSANRLLDTTMPSIEPALEWLSHLPVSNLPLLIHKVECRSLRTIAEPPATHFTNNGYRPGEKSASKPAEDHARDRDK